MTKKIYIKLKLTLVDIKRKLKNIVLETLHLKKNLSGMLDSQRYPLPY